MNYQYLLQRMIPFYVLIFLHVFHVNLISSNDFGKSNATATHPNTVIECEPGSFFNATTSQCEACPPGTYQPQAGQTECIPCPVGTFNAQSGQVQCQPCEAGYFNDQLGATECQPCPAGTTSNEGSTTCDLICANTWNTGPFSNCSETCGGGVQTRLVQCVDCNGNVVADSLCTDPKPAESQECNTHPCPIDCQVSAWSDWGTCSQSCGGGTQCRTRTVLVQPQFGGAECPLLQECRECNTQACCDNTWSTGAYSNCSETCGGGVQTRLVQCVDCNGNVVADSLCPDPKPAESQECNTHPCPIDCQVSAWSDWGTCSQSCGGGTQCRTRTVLVQPQFGGAECPVLEECRQCNTQACCDNTWSIGAFSNCSETCGGGVQTRLVQCMDCNGNVVADSLCTDPKPAESQECNTNPCPIDCQVSAWSEWDQCSESCGGGTQCRTRTVLVQPQFGGAECPTLEECRECNTQACDPCLNLICDDNDPCTIDRCENGDCINESLDCDDGNPCTNDICNPNPEPINYFSPDTASLNPNDCIADATFNLTVHLTTTSDGETFIDISTQLNSYDDDADVTNDTCDTWVLYDSLGIELFTLSGSQYGNGWDISYILSSGAYTLCRIECCENPDGSIVKRTYCADFSTSSSQCQNLFDCTMNGGQQCCDDGNPCTLDSCDPISGNCVNEPIICDDNDSCTVDYCDTNTGGCIHEVIPDCPTPCTLAVNIDPVPIIYPAYPPDSCATLTALTSGGNNPFSYLWSNGDTTESITVCPTTTTDYCVTVTDNNGCEGEYCIEVCVIDISCGNNPKNTKIALCNNGQVDLCVPINAVPGLLSSGATLGYCGDTSCTQAAMEQLMKSEQIEMVHVYPNPFSDRLIFEFMPAVDSHVKLEIFNLAGQSLFVIFEGNVRGGEMQYFSYTPTGEIAEGMVIYSLQTENGNHFGKAILVR